MPFSDYFAAQQRHLEQITSLPYFRLLMEPVDQLYEISARLIPPTTSPVPVRLFMTCHKAFLAAASFIARGQPSESAGITRRAIEAGCLARAIKHDEANLHRWLAYEARLARWVARRDGSKPKYKPTKIIDPSGHEGVAWLRKHAGIISDEAVHFSPESLDSEDWHEEAGVDTITLRLQYFEPSQRVIEREIWLLAGVHTRLIDLFDEYLDGHLSRSPEMACCQTGSRAQRQAACHAIYWPCFVRNSRSHKPSGNTRGPVAKKDHVSPRQGRPLRQQVGNTDWGVGHCQRGDRILRPKYHHGPVVPAEWSIGIAAWLSMYLEHAVHEVHDPVVGEAGARVEAALVGAVEGKA